MFLPKSLAQVDAQPTCSHGSGWHCLWLPYRLRTALWNQTLTARCLWLQAGVPHSNPGGPASRLGMKFCLSSRITRGDSGKILITRRLAPPVLVDAKGCVANSHL